LGTPSFISFVNIRKLSPIAVIDYSFPFPVVHLCSGTIDGSESIDNTAINSVCEEVALINEAVRNPAKDLFCIIYLHNSTQN